MIVQDCDSPPRNFALRTGRQKHEGRCRGITLLFAVLPSLSSQRISPAREKVDCSRYDCVCTFCRRRSNSVRICRHRSVRRAARSCTRRLISTPCRRSPRIAASNASARFCNPSQLGFRPDSFATRSRTMRSPEVHTPGNPPAFNAALMEPRFSMAASSGNHPARAAVPGVPRKPSRMTQRLANSPNRRESGLANGLRIEPACMNANRECRFETQPQQRKRAASHCVRFSAFSRSFWKWENNRATKKKW